MLLLNCHRHLASEGCSVLVAKCFAKLLHCICFVGKTRTAAKSSGRMHSAQPEPSSYDIESSPMLQLKKHRAGRIAQQTIIKGNIIYKRTESGGMVASLIKPDDSPAAIEASSTSQNTPKQRSRKIVPSAPFELELPYNCPINESNVGSILDESIFATQGVRRKLLTLKDDLRRQGGGPHVTTQLKPVHMKKRDEIAKQLTILYIDYQEALNKICNIMESLSEVHIPPPPPPSSLYAQSVIIEQPSVVRKHFVESSSSDPPKSKQPRPHVKSRKKGAREPRSAGASDDLWMSCEPGSDDELHHRFGFEPKKLKSK